MKILYLEWNSIGAKDLEEAFLLEGHELIRYPIVMEETFKDPGFEKKLTFVLQKEKPDLMFSVDYFPIFSYFGMKEKIRYVSWVYDSPLRTLYSSMVTSPCNVICLFDRALCMEFQEAGISTVRYLPMAANTLRLDSIVRDVPAASFNCDVSFVGSFYVEGGSPFDQMAAALPEYARGYLDGVTAAQMKIQGYDFVEEVLGPVIEELEKAYPMEALPSIRESREHFYGQFVINRRITSVERMELLTAVSKTRKVDVFTKYRDFSLPNLHNRGPVDYYKEMPLVFKQSRINLNISRRGLKSGIPLRAFDIMGSGGFLLSNFQADFLEHFVPEEDFVYYESKEDLVQRAAYYLDHDKERQEIAENGHNKVAAAHTYRHRVREMLNF